MKKEETFDEELFNEFFNVYRYFGMRADLEYMWENEVKNKEQLYHRFLPFAGGNQGDTIIEMWDRNLVRKDVDDWVEKN